MSDEPDRMIVTQGVSDDELVRMRDVALRTRDNLGDDPADDSSEEWDKEWGNRADRAAFVCQELLTIRRSDHTKFKRHIVEVIAREITASYYAVRLQTSKLDNLVAKNVEMNWRTIGGVQVLMVLGRLEAHGHPVPIGWMDVL